MHSASCCPLRWYCCAGVLLQHSRNQQYNNYMNLEADVAAAKPAVAAAATKTRPAPMYGFYRSWRQVSTSIVHFQLRNLVWATSGEWHGC